jgi:hypothetical protein
VQRARAGAVNPEQNISNWTFVNADDWNCTTSQFARTVP